MNPLNTRADLQELARTLFGPVLARWKEGAHPVLGPTGAPWDARTTALECVARQLWSLGPLAAGGGAFAHWARFRAALVQGTDPAHPLYWGVSADGRTHQRHVEMAGIAYGLLLAPHELWTPLAAAERARLAAWLADINTPEPYNPNNWHFFRVLVNEALATLGAPHDPARTEASLDAIDSYYLDDGWYADGHTEQRDYYVPFAMHFYGLFWASLPHRANTARAAKFRERARIFAVHFADWFSADGAALPYGRSLAYRCAQGAFWGALPLAGVHTAPGLSLGAIKGLYLRHLRWWLAQPAFIDSLARAEPLAIGYAYSNLAVAEHYISPGSPYWALKIFGPLALPASHAFWTTPEEPLPPRPLRVPQAHARMLLARPAPTASPVALCSGQWASWLHLTGHEKYAKFAYHAAFGFSVGTQADFPRAGDSMLLVNSGGYVWRHRGPTRDHASGAGWIASTWQPAPGCKIRTWLIALAAGWHARVHRLECALPCTTLEGGFNLPPESTPLPAPAGIAARGALACTFDSRVSGLIDLTGGRTAERSDVEPNVNLLMPRVITPRLVGRHAPGRHLLMCAVLGSATEASTGAAAWARPPTMEFSASEMAIRVAGEEPIIIPLGPWQ